MDERFGPEHRIRHRRDFERVYRHGWMAKTAHLRMFALPRTENPTPRLGLSVGTKVGKAVVRNRLKRWAREWFRTRKPRVWGWDVVIQAKRPASDLDAASFGRQLSGLAEELAMRIPHAGPRGLIESRDTDRCKEGREPHGP